MAASSYFRKIPYKQDMPPPGGYPKIENVSKLPKRGPPGLAIMASGLAVMGVGFYFVSKGNQNRRVLSSERKLARLHLLPILQAEQDRIILRQLKENFEKEKILMKDVPGWECGHMSIFNNSDKWVTPREKDLEPL